ncbi:DUF1467 family protein [Enterovirga sp.]|uniref:DUF1467 family protein n=1 Tax=Enterovirga sp. TaxID=2026350 RepID=UPI002C966D62|nr:DUF1467 family protein [Enterovirga sp.]HMO29297.1 DUF1467 family protein [Enterovirga sp.]
MPSLVARLAGSIWTTCAAVLLLGLAGIAGGRAFDLTTVGATGLYFIVWWMVLFTILPVRIRTQSDLDEVVPGTDPGAPSAPALRERAIWTSVVSTVVFVLIAAFFPLSGL